MRTTRKIRNQQIKQGKNFLQQLFLWILYFLIWFKQLFYGNKIVNKTIGKKEKSALILKGVLREIRLIDNSVAATFIFMIKPIELWIFLFWIIINHFIIFRNLIAYNFFYILLFLFTNLMGWSQLWQCQRKNKNYRAHIFLANSLVCQSKNYFFQPPFIIHQEIPFCIHSKYPFKSFVIPQYLALVGAIIYFNCKMFV